MKPQLGVLVVVLVVHALGQVVESTGTNLSEPDVQRPVAIGAERDEAAVRGDCGTSFGAVEIREAGEECVLEWVGGGRRRPPEHPHPGDDTGTDDRSCGA